MNVAIPDPVRGGDILPWANGVTDICRRFAAAGSGFGLVREGPGGIGFAPLPENKRGKSAAQVSHGCFDLEFVKEEEEDSGDSGGDANSGGGSGDTSGGDSGSDTGGEPVPKLVRQYYRIGHRLYNLGDASALDPELGAFVALKVSNITDDSITGAEIAQYEDWDTMAEESADVDAAIIPLYELKLTEDDNGQQKISGVAVDFRSMPVFVMAEEEEDAS